MENKEIAEFIFNKIRSYGFKPYEIDYGNGYFIFDHGENSVIHFRIKNMWKHWKFGLWISEENFNNNDKQDSVVAELFCQYDTQIDKFKPSRSSLCVSLTRDAIKYEMENKYNYFYELKSMLYMLKRHPFLAYQIDQISYKYYDDYFILDFIREESKELYENIKEHVFMLYVPYTKMKLWIARRFNFVKKADLYDFNKNNKGWMTSYKYEVKFVFSKDSTDEKEMKLLNWLFHKNEYGKFKNWRYTIKIDCVNREGIRHPYFYTRGE